MYPPVNPILVQIGSLSLHWYGIIMTLAIFMGALVANRYVARHGGDGQAIWDMLLWVLIPGIIGARLYYVFIQSPRNNSAVGFEHYLSHPIEIFEIWRGGIHIYGAFIFGAIALLLYMRRYRLPYLLYLDGIGLGLALGQAIGRLGNFINQELYGPPTTLPWGLRIDQAHRIPPYDNLVAYPDSVRFHPLFLYELLWDANGFALLLWISRRFAKRLLRGDLFLLYAIWVPLGRFLLEFLRTDSWFFPGIHINTVQILIAIAVIAAAIIFVRRDRSQAAHLATANGVPLQEGDTDTTPAALAPAPEATTMANGQEEEQTVPEDDHETMANAAVENTVQESETHSSTSNSNTESKQGIEQ